MGFFGKTQEKPFVSNNKLIEIVYASSAYVSEGIDEKFLSKALERQIERRVLYRNIESITPMGSPDVVLIKYKDLKVRSEFEVKQIREQLRREAGLDIER